MTASLLDTLKADGGFTYDPRSGELLRVGKATGYAIAVPGTERVVGRRSITRERFADEFARLIESYRGKLSGRVIGGWYSPERGVYLIELTEIHRVSRARAVRMGQARNQEAILNLATGEFIDTGGTGDART